MNTAAFVDQQIAAWKAEGKDGQWIAWNGALLCVGWPYVFGAWGAYCTTAERKKRYRDSHPTIYSACQVLRSKDPKPSCSGCKWFPNGERVRCYDCRGFTDWCLLQVGIDLIGEGATSQWNTAKNWSAKGKVKDGIPADTLVCLFKANGDKMEHTGLGLNGETVECSSGVQYSSTMSSKWTDWAVPVGISPSPVPPTPTPPEPTPTPEGYAIVIGKNLALREGPSTSCKVIARAPTGTKVKLTDPPSDWDHVSYNGKEGYMMSKYLQKG